MRMMNWVFATFCLIGVSVTAQPTNVLLPTTTPQPAAKPVPFLAWDSVLKEYKAKPGDTVATFTFNLTNISSSELVINGTQSSCGCTVAKLPVQPWKLAPGSNGQIQVTMNLAGKRNTVIKGITVLTSAGASQVQVKTIIPGPSEMSDAERARNAEVSKSDAQAIFKGSCAACHVFPSKGRLAGDLYLTMCGVCHESSRRADMVPNLHALLKPTDFDFWKTAITYGHTNSLMPGFAISQGGPLTDEQIDSVARFLSISLSRNYNFPPETNSVPVKSFGLNVVPVPPQPTTPAKPSAQTPTVPPPPTLN